MKVSVSVPPERDPTPAVVPWGQTPWLPCVLAAAYLAAHLPFLAPTLEDIDSLNFALGLRDFDPSQHQPHPPGYPVYIALARAALAAVHTAAPHMGRLASEAWALSIWSALGGAAAIVCGWWVFSLLAAWDRRDDTRPWPIVIWATLLMACSPLFWMTGLRPMSDMAGLAIALATQALLLRAARRPRVAAAGVTGPDVPGRAPWDALSAGAFLAGLGLGVRSQTFWLTLPLLACVLATHPAQRRLRATLRAAAAGAAGVVVWGVPLLVASGGLAAYLAALGAQAGEDIAHVDMLLADPTPRQLAFTLYRTFILPWGAVPLAAVVMAAACVGGAIMLARERRALVMLAVAFVPYLAFHLVYQETITVRYALPLVPAVAFVAARGVAAAGRFRDAIALPITAAALIVAVPGGIAYGDGPHPAFRALDDISRRADGAPPAFLTSHVSLARAIRAADPPHLSVRPARGGGDTRLELVKYWASGGTDPVWFLADPRRTDLELIDAGQRRDVVRYRWAVERRPELSGTRPMNADWYRMQPPRWFLGEGWSLTPETGGVVAAAGTGPDHAPITGYVRRSPEPMRLMIGGRHLGGAGDGPAAFELTLDGAVIDRWTLTVDERNFLRFVELPSGVPEGPDRYARMTVTSRAAAGAASRRVPVAVRQFDLQPSSSLVWGFGPGWHEDEYVFETGLRWRWTSERSIVQVRGPARAVRITVRGESPLRYFDVAPSVSVTAAGRTAGRLDPSSDFTWSVVVPAADVAASGGDIAIETNRVFSPSDSGQSADTRRLGLRIYECVVRPARDNER